MKGELTVRTVVAIVLVLCCGSGLGACSTNTDLNDEGRHVRLLNGAVPPACTSLGSVDASPYLPSSQPQINLRNNAGSLGANAVIVIRAQRQLLGMRYFGVAYICPETMLPPES
jgi:hypothetical protein